jgi:hypothetical protein
LAFSFDAAAEKWVAFGSKNSIRDPYRMSNIDVV